MLLRPRQEMFVKRSLEALDKYGNSLGIAPTGAGKTVMLSAVTGMRIGGSKKRVLVLQHRDELVGQNRKTFLRFNGDKFTASEVSGNVKEYEGQAIFAMVQTVSLDKNLTNLPVIDLVVIDEAHHAAAESYLKVIEHARSMNPKLEVFGVTATPQRGDGQGLLKAFDNVSDQIMIGELIRSGHLVRPRTYAIDLGVNGDMMALREDGSTEFDMDAVDKLLNTDDMNKRVIDHWEMHASERKTVVFCSTVGHAKKMAEAWRSRGYSSDYIDGNMDSKRRRAVLARYERGEIQVLTNCNVLTEGFDDQPTSCVVLLRPMSYQGTMIQMIGRGLRTVDPEKHPGLIKLDCIVLDFGVSTSIHGSLEAEADIHGRPMEDRYRPCPKCGGKIPFEARVCGICGLDMDAAQGGKKPTDSHDEAAEHAKAFEFDLIEIDLVEASPFKFEILEPNRVLMASGLTSWVAIVRRGRMWYGIGGQEGEHWMEKEMHLIAAGGRSNVIAACDDFLCLHGDQGMASKTKEWLNKPATMKQRKRLSLLPFEKMTRYRAACLLTWQFNVEDVWKFVKDFEAQQAAKKVAA